MSQLSIEKKIETAFKSVIGSETYISTNSIPVYSYRDVSHVRPQKCVVVKAGQAENETGATGIPGVIWNCPVEIFAISYTPDDKTRATVEAIYQACLGAVKGTTKAALTTAAVSGITFAGYSIKSGNEGQEDDTQYMSLSAPCSVYTS